MQNDFLRNLGHTNIHRMQLEGIKDDLAPLFKFVAGEPTCLIKTVTELSYKYYCSSHEMAIVL